MKERSIAIVSDGASSMRPEYSEVKDLNVTLLPLSVLIYENDEFKPYSEFEITLPEFYAKMENSSKLPKTDGNIQGRAMEVFKNLSEHFNVLSLHVSSLLSAAFQSATNAAEFLINEKPERKIDVIDTKQLSLGSWILVKEAAEMADQGKDINEIKNRIDEVIPKIKLVGALKNIKNAVAGGRGSLFLGNVLNSIVSLRPIFSFKEGKIKRDEFYPTFNRAKDSLYNRIKDVVSTSKLKEISLVHTNIPEIAGEFRDNLKKIYNQNIKLFDAGAVLGVHAGEGALAVIYKFA